MKSKKFLAVAMTCILAFSFAGCGTKDESTATDATATPAVSEEASSAEVTQPADDGSWSYASLKLGEDYTDLTATIKFFHHRTDRDKNSGGDGKMQEYIAEFNKLYPNITVDTEATTTYADDALLRLSTGDWGDIMMIPAVDKGDFATYFLPFGTTDEITPLVNYTTDKSYDGKVYGIPYMAGANGIVYNKAVFEKAGITTIPTTPDEFIAALKLVKEKTDAIPLYTNYFAQWTMGAWDAYIGAVSTGDFTWYNQKMIHTAAPFADPGDGTGAYNVFKILYDAVANDLIEDDYTTTDWEGCKGMINRGEIATMVLGSWAFSQMQAAGDNPDDIGYMPFPITVGGKQYAVAAPDYNFGINVNSSKDNQLAATLFVKWMTEESGWSFNEGGLPIDKDGQLPGLYQAFANCEMKEQDPAIAGEETILNDLNAESELNLNAGGNDKVMKIIENADTGAKSFDDIMGEWNKAWSDAQTSLSVEVK